MTNQSTASGILDPDFLQSVVRQATYQCRADGSCFYLWDSEKERLSQVATHNLQQIPWDDGLPGRVMSSGEAMTEICPDCSVSLAAPLIWQDAVRGVLIVFDGDVKRTFRDRDMALLQSLADMTASVGQQNERLARMTAQFRTLHTIDVALTSSLESERVLNLILEKAAELVNAEHGSLRQLDPESGKLVLKAHYGDGWTPEKLAYTPRIGQGIARWVAEHRRPYLSPDVRNDPLNVVLFEDMCSSISVPLQYGLEDPAKPPLAPVLDQGDVAGGDGTGLSDGGHDVDMLPRIPDSHSAAPGVAGDDQRGVTGSTRGAFGSRGRSPPKSRGGARSSSRMKVWRAVT